MDNRPSENPPAIMRGVVVVDGPIGAGKSTFCENLVKKLRERGAKVRHYPELIPENLEEYYRDPKKHAYDFQMKFMDTLFSRWARVGEEVTSEQMDFTIFDRYWGSTRGFIEYQYDAGFLTPAQYEKLTKRLNAMISSFPVLPEYFIFLDTKQSRCLRQIRARDREGENKTDDAVLTEINEVLRRYNFVPFTSLDLAASTQLKVPSPRPEELIEAGARVRQISIETPEGEPESMDVLAMPHKHKINILESLLRGNGPLFKQRREWITEALDACGSGPLKPVE